MPTDTNEKTAETTTAPAAEPQVTWHNEATAILVTPLENAPESFAAVELSLIAGRTIPDGDKVKRAAWRVKAIMDNAEFVEPNAAKAVNSAVRARYGVTKHHDVKGALADFKLPEMADDSAPDTSDDWTTYTNADDLKKAQEGAGEAAKLFLAGESQMRDGMRSLGQHIADVADTLEKPSAFNKWVESGAAELKRALANKNAKAEFVFAGRVPQDWFDIQPDSCSSAKTVQRNFNVDKNDLADAAAQRAWGKKTKHPSPADCQKALIETLEELSDDAVSAGVLAAAFLDGIMSDTENGAILGLAVSEGGGVEPAKAESGYVVSPLVATGARANEMLAAFGKAMAANAPAAKVEAEERAAEKEMVEAVKPRTFSGYAPREAALHLAKIMSTHDQWSEVLDELVDMAERAEKDTWEQVLTDVQEGINAAAAEAAAEEAEADADDDA